MRLGMIVFVFKFWLTNVSISYKSNVITVIIVAASKTCCSFVATAAAEFVVS